MTTISRRLLAVAAAVVWTVAMPSVAMSDERVALDGLWTGDLGTGADRVGFVFQIGENGAGTVRILDPGGPSSLAVGVTASSAAHVVIEALGVNGRFEGSAKVSGRLEGRWIQSGGDQPLVLTRTEKP